MTNIIWNQKYEEQGDRHGKMDAIKTFLEWNYTYPHESHNQQTRITFFFDEFKKVIDREIVYRTPPTDLSKLSYYNQVIVSPEYKFGYKTALRDEVASIYTRFETFIAESAERATRQLFEQKAAFFSAAKNNQ